MPGLKLKEREGIWYAVGTFDGQRIRDSLGTRDRKEATEKLAIFQAELFKRSTYGEEAVRLFEDAAISYMRQGGEARFLSKIIKHFKNRKIASIKPGEIRDMALTLYPGKTAATRNRQALIPTRAVINHAHSLGWCPPMKIKMFEGSKSRKHTPVDDIWLEKFMAQADADKLQHLSGLVLFMNQTGARVSEAVNLLGEHVDLENRTALLAKTKTEEWSARQLTAELAIRLSAMDLGKGVHVFSYTDPKAVNKRIAAVCKRAKIEKRTTHSAGRHSFGTNAMNLPEANIKDAMEAGGWKSAKLFLETYVHSSDAGRRIAEKFDKKKGLIGTEQSQPTEKKGYRFGKKNIK